MSGIDWLAHPGGKLTLAPNEAHIWSIAPAAELAQCLSAAEADRHGGMSSVEAALHYATSQGGLRKILSGYLEVEPAKITILRQGRGKPYVSGGPEFNITHTGEHILVAFAHCPVGLDVEIASRRVSSLELARKFFANDEAAHLESMDEADRGETFLRYWVRKEATVKLSGDGIYHGLRDAAVKLTGESGASGTYRGRPVWLSELRPAPGVVAALASWEPFQAKCFLRF